MKIETLAQAIYLGHSGKSKYHAIALRIMDGKPVGGWPETQQALSNLAELLPSHIWRAYTLAEFIDATYDVVGADSRVSGRYHAKFRAGDVTLK